MPIIRTFAQTGFIDSSEDRSIVVFRATASSIAIAIAKIRSPLLRLEARRTVSGTAAPLEETLVVDASIFS